MEIADFVAPLIFSEEATFLLSRNVSRNNVRFWKTKNPSAAMKIARDSPHVNVFYHKQEVRANFFSDQTRTVNCYQDMLQLWRLPQLNVMILSSNKTEYPFISTFQFLITQIEIFR
ncbi:hypothetical protein TNIN_173891 [Trichonephila inaurata madagascariensis]|uniref:Uncharacterized protein n=1 Tax=Trichonephila inaurata madagascariensis TaxID=2747483 RepID=A0A8X6XP48_9ARAC|nr:hypothetical protein TNIN_319181 [Trichonephila inaurata madagascariensis]GFY76190.1 hypothetical protein TNIN_173891 [Trichonephila inaurata madagascariensis]